MQNTQQNDRIFRFVLPKKGRLKDDFSDIATQAGLSLVKDNPRQDFGTMIDKQGEMAPFETLLQRAGDAIENINDGLADMAVVGLDKFEEARCQYGDDFKIDLVGAFNLSACALWIATPDSAPLQTPQELSGKRIVTSYPNILARWLDENGVTDTTIIAREGGVEDYVRLGLADAVCDVVESGNTLVANGLAKTMKLFDSTAVLVARRGLKEEQAIAAQNLAGRLAAVQSCEFYCGQDAVKSQILELRR